MGDWVQGWMNEWMGKMIFIFLIFTILRYTLSPQPKCPVESWALKCLHTIPKSNTNLVRERWRTRTPPKSKLNCKLAATCPSQEAHSRYPPGHHVSLPTDDPRRGWPWGTGTQGCVWIGQSHSPQLVWAPTMSCIENSALLLRTLSNPDRYLAVGV